MPRYLLITLAVIATGVIMIRRYKPRNVRNNNPLNLIKDNRYSWVGEIGHDISGFIRFETPELGFRAAYKNLMTYKNKYGIDSISAIIDRWTSGDSQEIQSNYKLFLVNSLQLDAEQQLNENDYPNLLLAMSYFEGAQGRNEYTLEQVQNGVALA